MASAPRGRGCATLGAAVSDTSRDDLVIGELRPTGVLGTGRLATVYRAVDPRGRAVAMHVLHDELAGDEDFAAAFVALGRRARRLRHPLLVRVLGDGLRDGAPFLVTELVDGAPLVLPPPEPWSEARVLRLAEGLLGALAEAHAQGLVHGELGAKHLLVAADGEVRLKGLGFAVLWDALAEARAGARSGARARRSAADARDDVAAAARLLRALGASGGPPTDVGEVLEKAQKIGSFGSARALAAALRGAPTEGSESASVRPPLGGLAASAASPSWTTRVVLASLLLLLVWTVLRTFFG